MEGIVYWRVIQITHFLFVQKNLSRQSCTLWTNIDSPPWQMAQEDMVCVSLGGYKRGVVGFFFFFFPFLEPLAQGPSGGVGWVYIFVHCKDHHNAIYTLVAL